MIQINALELVFTIKAQASGRISHNSGSIFRGMIGKQLKSKSCINENVLCDDCSYLKDCSYGLMFQPLSKQLAPQYEKVMKYLTPPFLLEPPYFTNQCWKKGETKQLKIKLLGQLSKKYIYDIVDSIIDISKLGVGPDRISFEIVEAYKVTDQGKEFTIDQGNIELTKLAIGLKEWESNQYFGNEKIVIKLETPLRIQKQGKIQKTLENELFIQNIVRRVNFVIDLYGYSDQIIASEQLAEIVNGTHIENPKIEWEDFRRYSSRLDSQMNLGGMIGSFEITGQLNGLLPYLLCGSYVHIGKQTVFGLGKYSLWQQLS